MLSITITDRDSIVQDEYDLDDYIDEARLDFPNDTPETHLQLARESLMEDFEGNFTRLVNKVVNQMRLKDS